MLKATIVSVCTSFLLISRTLYNLLAISVDKLELPDFNFDWINVSDQVSYIFQMFEDCILKSYFNSMIIKADFANLTESKKYISFVVVLLIWELIPTFVVIVLFRLKQADDVKDKTLCVNSISNASHKSVFLDSHVNDLIDDSSVNTILNENDREILIKNKKIRNSYNSINF